MKRSAFPGTSTKMEPSPLLCKLTAFPIKFLVGTGAPSPNPANRSSPERGFSFFQEDLMPEKISHFTILVRDMRAAQKAYFKTRSTDALNHAKELEKQVDDQLAAILGGVQLQGTLL